MVNEITLTGSRCVPVDVASRLMDRGLVSTGELGSGVYRLKEYKQVFSNQTH